MWLALEAGCLGLLILICYARFLIPWCSPVCYLFIHVQ